MCKVHVYVCARTCARFCTSICERNSKLWFTTSFLLGGRRRKARLGVCVCLSLLPIYRIYRQQSTSTVTCVIGIPLRVTDLVVRRIIIGSSAQDAFCLSLVVAEDDTPSLFLARPCAGNTCAAPSQAWRQFRLWIWRLIQDSCLLWKLPCFVACAHDAMQDSTQQAEGKNRHRACSHSVKKWKPLLF